MTMPQTALTRTDRRRPVLVFDGDCGMCTRAAGLVTDRFRPSPEAYDVEPAQRLDLAALGLTADQCDEALQWVGADGRVSSAQDAVARMLLASRAWARPLGAVLLLPGVNTLAGAAYRWVARHRHRFPGGTPACEMPQLPPSTQESP